jgi:murein DD-endopeptidase MepM/ murein hydrolase activator NlpD
VQLPRPHPIRDHGGALFVVLALLVALLSPVWPAGASGAPVVPVPVGVWPLQPPPPVVRAFDPPDLPFGTGHRGVDLLGTPGQEVHSALVGRVTYAGRLAGRGVVVVDHGATRTTYEPVLASVRVGDRVESGQVLGRLELFASHCLPRACLHWGWIRGDETYLDPLLLVGGDPIRLLPLWVGSPAVPGPLWRPPVQPYAGLVDRWGLRERPRPFLRPPVCAPVPRWALVMPRQWTRPMVL